MSCNWPITNLGEFASLFTGFPFKSKYFSDDKGTKLLRGDNVAQGRLRWENAKRWFDDNLIDKHSGYKLRTGDVILAMDRPWIEAGLKFAQIQQQDLPCLLVQRVACLRAYEKCDQNFLKFIIGSRAFTEYVKLVQTGTAVPHISGKQILAFEFRLPPKHVRVFIGGVLAKLDSKITTNTQTNQTLEEMAQAIFKSWFVDFDPVKAKMRGEQLEGIDAETASLFPEKLVESELGLIPEGWPVDQVSNHIDVTKGKSYKSAELQESTTALVTLKSFKRGGGYRMDGLKEYTGKYKPQQVIEAGDLVMSLTDVTQAAEIVGKPALVIDAPQYDTLVASLDVAILRPKETDAKQYFYGLMSTYRFHRYAESFATGTTVLHLSPKGITTFEFACPSTELVKKYHEFAAPIFAKIEANILESQELAKLRDTLLPKLLSGEIELGDAEKVAEVG